MVPTGRLELPRIAPLAPQASVSTNSTTSAYTKDISALSSQGFSGPGCAGAEAGGAFSSSGAAGEGAGDGAVAGVVGCCCCCCCCILSRIEGALVDASFWNKYVRHR